LAARFLEERGFSTIVLNPTWEFHRAVGIPRTATIEYPYGRLFGEPGDKEGQSKILIKTLEALESCEKPGQIIHLPFIWHEEPKKTNWQPPEMSPMIKYYLEDIKKARLLEGSGNKAN